MIDIVTFAINTQGGGRDNFGRGEQLPLGTRSCVQQICEIWSVELKRSRSIRGVVVYSSYTLVLQCFYHAGRTACPEGRYRYQDSPGTWPACRLVRRDVVQLTRHGWSTLELVRPSSSRCSTSPCPDTRPSCRTPRRRLTDIGWIEFITLCSSCVQTVRVNNQQLYINNYCVVIVYVVTVLVVVTAITAVAPFLPLPAKCWIQ